MSELEEQRERPRTPTRALHRHRARVGGALGAPARYEIAQLIPITPGTFPWATFWTNVSGAFVLGVFLTIVIERFPPTRVRPSLLRHRVPRRVHDVLDARGRDRDVGEGR